MTAYLYIDNLHSHNCHYFLIIRTLYYVYVYSLPVISDKSPYTLYMPTKIWLLEGCQDMTETCRSVA